jgi:hypothetical protein
MQRAEVEAGPAKTIIDGSHRHIVLVDRAAWELAAGATYAKFAVRRRSLRSMVERGWTR